MGKKLNRDSTGQTTRAWATQMAKEYPCPDGYGIHTVCKDRSTSGKLFANCRFKCSAKEGTVRDGATVPYSLYTGPGKVAYRKAVEAAWSHAEKTPPWVNTPAKTARVTKTDRKPALAGKTISFKISAECFAKIIKTADADIVEELVTGLVR